ncbi:MAG TPA: hypothetical protein VHH92_04215 [Actinomycetota bacterium]|nr:hypothetical protein [Actinomycetota bacterium]
MFAFLRRHQPQNPVLAVLYWVVAVAIAMALLFFAFYWLDNYLPGGGMF